MRVPEGRAFQAEGKANEQPWVEPCLGGQCVCSKLKEQERRAQGCALDKQAQRALSSHASISPRYCLPLTHTLSGGQFLPLLWMKSVRPRSEDFFF